MGHRMHSLNNIKRPIRKSFDLGTAELFFSIFFLQSSATGGKKIFLRREVNLAIHVFTVTRLFRSTVVYIQSSQFDSRSSQSVGLVNLFNLGSQLVQSWLECIEPSDI